MCQSIRKALKLVATAEEISFAVRIERTFALVSGHDRTCPAIIHMSGQTGHFDRTLSGLIFMSGQCPVLNFCPDNVRF